MQYQDTGVAAIREVLIFVHVNINNNKIIY